MKTVRREFFEGDTITIAKKLLGCYLFHETPEGICVGKILETEAYLWNDPASHSFKGKTQRNSAMFEDAGTAYVYFTYGMHHCFNVVTNTKNVGEAVLIRALEPIEGITLMKKRRGTEELKHLCSGPAKLVQAFGIRKEDTGKLLWKGNLKILKGNEKEKFEIAKTRRIGISQGREREQRFFIKENMFISKIR